MLLCQGTNVPEYSTIIFGGGVLYNHMASKTVQHYGQYCLCFFLSMCKCISFPYHTSHFTNVVSSLAGISHGVKIDASVNLLPYSTSELVSFVATKKVRPGQELYTNYGDDWFEGE